MSFLWFRAYEKNPGKANSASSWVLFYVHRIVRYRFNLVELSTHFKIITRLLYRYRLLHIRLQALYITIPSNYFN